MTRTNDVCIRCTCGATSVQLLGVTTKGIDFKYHLGCGKCGRRFPFLKSEMDERAAAKYCLQKILEGLVLEN